MIRNLKALGLALVAVFALGAMLASGASAAVEHPGKLKFTTGEGPFSLVAHQINGKHKFTLTDDGNINTECSTATFEGKAENTQSTLRVHPVYGGCTSFLGVEATINTASCDYEFHIGGTVAGQTHQYEGTVTLIKSGEAACAITITSASCQVTVDGPQTLSKVVGVNTTTDPEKPAQEEDVDINAEVSGINYTVTKDGLFCPLNNGQTSGVEGDYTGQTTLTAFDKNGNKVEHQIEMGEVTP